MARKSYPYVMRPRSKLPPRPSAADPRIPRIAPTRLTAAALRALTRDTALDPRLRGVDRYLWRWSVGQGAMLPLSAEDADALPPSRPPPLADDEAVIVDQVIIHSPPWASRFVFLWFRSDRTTSQIAAELERKVRAVYEERRVVLAYYLGRLTETGITLPSWEA